MILAAGAGDLRAAFVEQTRKKDITAEADTRAAGGTLSEVHGDRKVRGKK
jgi:hypothetical protein